MADVTPLQAPARVVARAAMAVGLMLLLALGLAAALLAWQPWQQARAQADQDARWRAEQVASKLADRVAHALAVGIPLAQLSGVDELFRQQLAALPELQVLGLESAGQVQASARREASSASPGPAAAEVLVRVPVGQAAEGLFVVVRSRLQAPWALRWAWLTPLAAVVALGALLAAALAAWGWASGWKQRETLVRQLASDPALELDVPPAWQLPSLGRREHDLRPNWIADQWRRWREAHAQWVRLAESLLKTEADADRRAALAARLAAAQAQAQQQASVSFSLQGPSAGAAVRPSSERTAARGRSLHMRLAALLAVSVAALALLGGGALWQYSHGQAARFDAALVKAQTLAFARVEASGRAALETALQAPDWQAAFDQAVAAQNADSLGHALDRLVRDRPTWTAELYDQGFRLVASTAQALKPQAVVDMPSLQQARPLAAPGALQVGQSRNQDGHYTVLVQTRGGFTVVLGERWSADLSGLKQALGADMALVNLRGQVLTSTVPGLGGREGFLAQTRDAGVQVLPGDGGRVWRAVVQPLVGLQGRPIGALVGLYDETQAQHAEQRQWLGWLAVFALALVVLVLVLRWQLRRFVGPLERSVDVLEGLAQGRTDQSPDEAEQAQPGEAGAVARGVTALRLEMLNLQVLRDERVRLRRQQERLIRRELARLAASLDEASRAEVMAALSGASDHPAASDGRNELAGLAQTLARLTDLVTGQQTRLLKLLADLRTAMVQQAQLLSLQQELEIAQRMQASILPRAALPLREVELASLMVPAKEVGGDFYDYFQPTPDTLAVVVADVSGKGVPAALFMAVSRTLLKANAMANARPDEAMTRLNDQLCEENEQMMFVTAFFALLHLRTGHVQYVNAGHNPPLWVQASGTTWLPKGENPALAVIDGVPYRSGELQLAPGDALLLYTDGVTEATRADGTLFGEAALAAALHVASTQGGTVAHWPEQVLAAVRAFEAGAPQADDITCLALRYQP